MEFSGLRSSQDQFEAVFDESLIRDILARRWENQEILGAGRCFEARAIGAGLVVKRVMDVQEDPAYWRWWQTTLAGLRDLCGVQAGWPPYRLLAVDETPILVMPKMQHGLGDLVPAKVSTVGEDLIKVLAARQIAVRDHWQWGRLGGLPFLMDLSDIEPL